MAKQLIRNDQLRSGGGAVYIRDVETTDPDGTAVDKIWQNPPNNTVLQYVKVSDLALDVTIKSFYPNVIVDGNPFTLPPGGDDYLGTVSILMADEGDLIIQAITPDDTPGGKDTCAVELDLPPEVQSAVFDSPYPGVQTELNADQTANLVVTADKPFNRIVVINYEAGEGENIDGFGDVTNVTVPIKIAARGIGIKSQQAVRLQLRDAVSGALGPTYDTDSAGTVDGVNVVELNNDTNGLALVSREYEGGRTAAKDTETVVVTTSRVDPAGTFLYSDPTGLDLTIPDVNTYENIKTCTLKDPNRTNDSQTNFRIVATKTSNGKVQTLNVQVVVHDEPATIGVSIAGGSVVVSGGNDGTSVVQRTVTISSNQALPVAPTLSASGGTFLGSWAGSGKTWTRTLQAHDDDPKGAYQFTGLVAVNGALIEQNTINIGENFTFKGFVARDLSVLGGANGADFHTEVVDIDDFVGGSIPGLGLTLVTQPIGTPVQPDTPENEGKRGWCTVDELGKNPTRLLLLHQGTIDGNITGMTIVGVQETV